MFYFRGAIITMFDLVRRLIPLRSRLSESELDSLVEFSTALAVQFGDRLPSRFKVNLFTAAAWWSVALYVQAAVILKRRLSDQQWRQAMEKLSTPFLKYEGVTSTLEERDEELKEAVTDAMFHVNNLWIAIFGPVAKPKQLIEKEFVFSKLFEAFSNKDYQLAERFLLEEQIPTASGDETSDDDGDDITEFCESFTLFFEICSRSRP